MICINDNSQMEDIEKEEKWIQSIFESTFNEKSSYEV